jgi:hypothetical protein
MDIVIKDRRLGRAVLWGRCRPRIIIHWVNGGATAINAERLKIVNAAGTGGNVRRWNAMQPCAAFVDCNSPSSDGHIAGNRFYI